MSGYILCQTPVARQPYFIRRIQMNIYSLEELCYYLHHNLYLIDESIMNEELTSWLSNELGLTSLAQKLRSKLGKFTSLEDFLYPIFKEINYLTYEELKKLSAELSAYDAQLPVYRMKYTGDALMENRMYMRAIETYEKVLNALNQASEEKTASKTDRIQNEDTGETTDKSVDSETDAASEQSAMTLPHQMTEEERYRGMVLHNLGLAFTRLFHMDKAVEYFREAFAVTGESGEAVSCVLAYRIGHSYEEFEAFLEAFDQRPEIRTETMKEMKRFDQLPEIPVQAEQINHTLDRFMNEYHRSMSQ